jgi:hypothetical protein
MPELGGIFREATCKIRKIVYNKTRRALAFGG